MKILQVAIAAALAACTAGAQDIRFVSGQGSAEALTDTERGVALLAIDALAADLKVPKDRILVDTIRAVEWRDSSLGCPKPGLAYLDVITPGHRVTLRVDQEIYIVHEAGNRAFVCRANKAMGGFTPERELVFGKQMAAARKDLASRIGADEKEVTLQSAEGRTFSDSSLGCPELGKMYTQATVEGWVLTFSVRGRDYTYHTDLARTIPCPAITAE